MLIGQTLKSYREQRGISLRQLAKIIGVVPSSLYRFEKNGNLGDKNWARIMVWLLQEKDITPK